MPEHYAVDVNVISGSVHFDNAKLMSVMYTNSNGDPVSFSKSPRLQLTVLNTTVVNPFKTQDIKAGNLFTGFKIGFQSNQTLDVEWQVMERA
jgi:hypothetical protein